MIMLFLPLILVSIFILVIAFKVIGFILSLKVIQYAILGLAILFVLAEALVQ